MSWSTALASAAATTLLRLTRRRSLVTRSWRLAGSAWMSRSARSSTPASRPHLRPNIYRRTGRPKSCPPTTGSALSERPGDYRRPSMSLRTTISCPGPRSLLAASLDILPSGLLFEALLRISPTRTDAAEFCIGICRKPTLNARAMALLVPTFPTHILPLAYILSSPRGEFALIRGTRGCAARSSTKFCTKPGGWKHRRL